MKDIKSLTKAEEQIMLILWKIKKGFIKDIIKHISDKKPAYNTVSTIVRILEKKGYIKHIVYGTTYQYLPAVSKEKYRTNCVQELIKKYFNNSFSSLAHCFYKKENIDIAEVDEALKMLEEIKNKNRE